MASDRPATAHAGSVAQTRSIGRFEQLPKWLNLIPMVLQWLWLGLRHGSVTLPSAANPRITAGGLVGEGKLEYFNLMGPLARAATAEHIGLRIDESIRTQDAVDAMHAAGLGYPIVVKPDLGWCGHGVRRIDDSGALAHYLSLYPRGQMLVLQRYLADDGEAGLFYMRHRDEPTGRLIGVLLRHYPHVIGNGCDTVAALIAADARLKRATGSRLHECRYDPEHVPVFGEKVRLSTIASTRVGGMYEDATTAVTPALTARVDAIAGDMPDFHVGRFDVRYSTLEALRGGTFTIMEVNGAGSEAVHAWDPKYTIAQVYGIVFAKQRALFRIAAANRRAGHRPIGMRSLARLYWKQQELMARYPPSN